MEKMIGNLKVAFKDMLEYNTWMDEDTKVVAREKVSANNLDNLWSFRSSAAATKAHCMIT